MLSCSIQKRNATMITSVKKMTQYTSNQAALNFKSHFFFFGDFYMKHLSMAYVKKKKKKTISTTPM